MSRTRRPFWELESLGAEGQRILLLYLQAASATSPPCTRGEALARAFACFRHISMIVVRDFSSRASSSSARGRRWPPASWRRSRGPAGPDLRMLCLGLKGVRGVLGTFGLVLKACSLLPEAFAARVLHPQLREPQLAFFFFCGVLLPLPPQKTGPAVKAPKIPSRHVCDIATVEVKRRGKFRASTLGILKRTLKATHPMCSEVARALLELPCCSAHRAAVAVNCGDFSRMPPLLSS